jgi:hypothetical protein
VMTMLVFDFFVSFFMYSRVFLQRINKRSKVVVQKHHNCCHSFVYRCVPSGVDGLGTRRTSSEGFIRKPYNGPRRGL